MTLRVDNIREELLPAEEADRIEAELRADDIVPEELLAEAAVNEDRSVRAESTEASLPTSDAVQADAVVATELASSSLPVFFEPFLPWRISANDFGLRRVEVDEFDAVSSSRRSGTFGGLREPWLPAARAARASLRCTARASYCSVLAAWASFNSALRW